MFYNEYLDDFYLYELFENYDINILKSVEESNFKKIYNLFKKYHFTFIEDIILRYLEIFTMDYNLVEKKILSLKKALGENYLDIISEDTSYLEYIARG